MDVNLIYFLLNTLVQKSIGNSSEKSDLSQKVHNFLPWRLDEKSKNYKETQQW